MHILHVIDGLGLGGAERMLVDIANQTVADGHEASVCVTRSNVTLEPALDPRINRLVLNRKRRVSVAKMLRFTRWVREQRVDVLHVHLRSNLSFVLPLRIMRLVRQPIVFHDHFGGIETDQSIPPWFRVASRFIAHYVGVYDRLSAWAQRAGVPANRTTTITNTLDLSRLRAGVPGDLRKELAVPDGSALAVLVATVRRDKGIEVLLDAVSQSRHRGTLCVVIVGADGEPDYVASVRSRWKELGLEDTVHFLGPRTDVPALLAAADLGLVTSHTESGPLVLIEYLAAGLPVVSTEVGDIGRRLAAMSVPGFVPPGDPRAFAEKLDALLDLPRSARQQRGSDGRTKLETGWDIRSTMPRWYELYRSAIQTRR
ncbi:MAG: glycosyltransferase [Deltaproteobacteria bacterium]|nr:glycosyltransferase [Deltaproteobacteria bacterium]